MSKIIHFISLGCPKNLVDSELMMGKLLNQKYQVTDNPADAEVIIINTCGFIQEAKEESISRILEMATLKQNGSLKQLVVTGCLTQRYKEELVKELPEVDLFIGTGDFQNIDKLINQQSTKSASKTFFQNSTYLDHENIQRVNSLPSFKAYLKVSEGCDKRCTFCAIPMIRGNLQSRSIKSIINEAKLLIESGLKELTIVSHDFTDYGRDIGENPTTLLKCLSQLNLPWIRLLYLYPDAITEEMIEIINDSENLLKYFDLPLQHINDLILKRMNRKTTRRELDRVIKMIRKKIPSATLRTHFLVGFPGETEAIFQELLEFVKDYEFDHVGCFAYSQEDGTPASRLKDQIEEETKQRRLSELMEIQKKICLKKNKKLIGKKFQVLIEGVSEESEHFIQGRMSSQAIDIDGVVLINQGHVEVGNFSEIEITEVIGYDFVGKVTDNALY